MFNGVLCLIAVYFDYRSLLQVLSLPRDMLDTSFHLLVLRGWKGAEPAHALATTIATPVISAGNVLHGGS